MLEDWLSSVANVKKDAIDMGLDRCIQVAESLDLIHWDIPVIVVAGTNGKGSTLAVLDAIYAAAGYRRLLYTSPHIQSFNERIQLDGVPVADDVFMQAVKTIDAAREGVHLTFFEYATFAALLIAKKAELDVLLLEVGLGGRLDVVNIVESDLAVITSISLDHVEYLGDTREKIAFEKAGIFRQNKPAVCGELDIPSPIIEKANALSVPLSRYGVEYRLTEHVDGWTWVNESGLTVEGNSPLFLKTENVATGLQAVYLLQDKLPVPPAVLKSALDGLKLSGRMQFKWIQDRECLFDVAHNPQAAKFLAGSLTPIAGRTWALFSALASKDVQNMLSFMQPVIDGWLAPQLTDFRAMPLSELEANFVAAGVEEVSYFSSTQEAVAAFFRCSAPGDRCVVFGSFVTVGSVQADMEKCENENGV